MMTTTESLVQRLEQENNSLRKENVGLKTAMDETLMGGYDLISSQGILQALLHHAPDAIIVLNEKHQVDSFNQAAQRLFGYLEIDVQNKLIDGLGLFQVPDDYDASIAEYLISSGGANGKQQVLGQTNSGKTIPLRIAVSEIQTNKSTLFENEEDGRVTKFDALLCYVFDITAELKQLKTMKTQASFMQQATIKFQKLQAKSEKSNQLKTEFLANMSHELRTPMQAILGFADRGISKIDAGNRDGQLRYFNNIKKGGLRLLALLNDLLDLSKLEAGKIDLDCRDLDLIDVISTSIQELKSLADEKSIDIEISQSEVSTLAYFDFNKMFQVIHNLLSNAIKFTPVKGNVSISFSRAKLAETIPAIAVTVADTGIGIPESELESVFDKFTQSTRTRTGGGGTGLGLAICKEILAVHNGTITAASIENEGSQFTFTLPLGL